VIPSGYNCLSLNLTVGGFFMEIKRNDKGRFVKEDRITQEWRNCLSCGEKFLTRVSPSRGNKGKYCSKKCINYRGRISWNLGSHLIANVGEKNYNWKGDRASKVAIHYWLYRRLGKATKCSNPNCFYPRRSGHRILFYPQSFEWANISHEYHRDVKDFISLCVSCHHLYDYHKCDLQHIPIKPFKQ
jgi:hypothetical protein